MVGRALAAGHGVDASSHLLGGSDLRCWQPFGVLVCGEGPSPPVHQAGHWSSLR